MHVAYRTCSWSYSSHPLHFFLLFLFPFYFFLPPPSPEFSQSRIEINDAYLFSLTQRHAFLPGFVVPCTHGSGLGTNLEQGEKPRQVTSTLWAGFGFGAGRKSTTSNPPVKSWAIIQWPRPWETSQLPWGNVRFRWSHKLFWFFQHLYLNAPSSTLTELFYLVINLINWLINFWKVCSGIWRRAILTPTRDPQVTLD